MNFLKTKNARFFVWRIFIFVIGLFPCFAFSLKSDKDQPVQVSANYSKSTQAANPEISILDGDVVIVQGSIKITSDHGTIYRIPAAASDVNAGQVSRMILTGKQAHLQQISDGDCRLMTANADKIDYNPLTKIAELTGGVIVLQQGRGEFRGEHMIYNTDTGDMESGSRNDSSGRVSMVMEPKTSPPASNKDNCGFPAKTSAKSRAY